MTIRITKLSPTHHRFQIIRSDGSTETAELETRSFLLHDLIHFAVETEARLMNSFYGLLASGSTYASLSPKSEESQDSQTHEELWMTEGIVGPMTGLIQGKLTEEELFAVYQQQFKLREEAIPEWLTSEFIPRVNDRMRHLLGHWRGTPFHETMELHFPGDLHSSHT